MKSAYLSFWIFVLIVPIALSGCSGNGTIGPEAANYVSLQSDSGDYIGGGQTYQYSQSNAKMVVNAAGGHLTITIDGDQNWSGDFQVPSNLNQLQVGRYDNLQRYPLHDPVKGGLNWSGEGRGSNTLTGWFVIDKVTYENGALTAIDLRFEQHSEGASPGLRGQIHWKSSDTTTPPGPVKPAPVGLWRPPAGSTPPIGNYIYLKSDAGDYVGGGQTYTYTHSNARITVSATEGHLSVIVNGSEAWSGNFQAMNILSQFQQGYYGDLRRYPFHNPVKGGLNWSGVGRGSNAITGWFVIDSVTYENGVLTAIDLRFEQHSEAASPALHGQIHWKLSDLPADTWQQTTGPTTTRINSIATSGQNIYVGTDEGGLFRSTDGSSTWSALSSGLPTSPVFSLAIDPSNTQTIYAGTMYGVYKSTNGGDTWGNPSNGQMAASVACIVIDQTNSQTIYAGINSGGVFKSIDGGNSWNPFNNGFPSNTFVMSLTIDPANSDIIYAGTYSGGVFKSINAGGAWSAINTGLSTNYYIWSLVIDPSSNQTVYAATNGAGAFKTTNAGGSWSAARNGLASFVLSLFIDPVNTQNIYAGTYYAGLYKSTDGGSSWSSINIGQVPLMIWSIAIDETHPRTIYAGTEEGKVLKGIIYN
jgi:photosystem II stability/assembly factor-like uncharacterized protein